MSACLCKQHREGVEIVRNCPLHGEPDDSRGFDWQLRKGIDFIVNEVMCACVLYDDEPQERRKLFDAAQYARDLVIEMVTDTMNGQPKPWSHYRDRVVERFGDVEIEMGEDSAASAQEG